MGMFFEEFEVGQVFKSRGRTVTEADIVNFAGLSGDYNPLHTDEEFAKKTIFGKRIAHGMLGLTISTGLSQRLGILDDTIMAFLGLEWSFRAPIFIGDTVHLEQTVKSKRETSKPDRGIIVFESKLINQNGESVQEGSRTVMVRRKQ
jgi:acyl dehydratase